MSITFYVYMIEIENKFIENIKYYNMIEDGDKVLVGLSGGADSVTLLHLLCNGPYDIGAVHIHHGVRGDEADRDEAFCKELCKDLGVEFFSRRVDMNSYAKEKKISKEEAGRILRRQIFREICDTYGYSKIALAHNYNDQVETILMRIFRGTGIDGLSGIEYKSGEIIRPLLNIKRSEIEEYIKDNDLKFMEDSTNLENDYNRNKIRNLVIPYIEETMGDIISDNIFNLGDLARIDANYLDSITSKEFEKSCKISDYYIQLNIEKFNNLDESIKNRLIRKIIYTLNGDTKDLSKVNVEDIISLTTSSSGREIENIAGINIRKSFGNLIFSKNIERAQDFEITLESGKTFTHNGYSIEVKDSDKIIETEDSISVSNELITEKLVLRNRRAGDMIFPPGRHRKKLKDIFIENKIDKLDRDKYLVVADSKRVYWVVGLVKSAQLKEDGDSYKVITIKRED